MLNSKQKRQLKALATNSKIKYQIGKNEITNSVLETLDNGLTAHELIKINVMKTVKEEKMQFAFDLASKLNADIVEVIGSTIVLFRRNKEKPQIQLVK